VGVKARVRGVKMAAAGAIFHAPVAPFEDAKNGTFGNTGLVFWQERERWSFLKHIKFSFLPFFRSTPKTLFS
jgi:hypothetical protein